MSEKNAEEKEIMKKVKNKKKDTKRKRAREHDDFDEILESYQKKFLKKFNDALEKEDKSKPKFEEITMND